jgi:hypothetical protein
VATKVQLLTLLELSRGRLLRWSKKKFRPSGWTYLPSSGTVMDQPLNQYRLTHLKNGLHRNLYEAILFQYHLRGCTNILRIYSTWMMSCGQKTCDSLGSSARIQTPTA